MVKSFCSGLLLSFLVLMLVCSGCHKAPPKETQEKVTSSSESVPEGVPKAESEWDSQSKQTKSVDVLMKESESILLDVHFDYDKYDLKPESRQTLAKIADWLLKNPTVKTQLEGHCDERGSNEYNLALGERRAKACLTYLINMGVNQANLTIISYGEEKPIDAGHTDSAWAKNRRCHFKPLFY
jgi:peptidoglycan-associated lipoprotein